MRKLKKIFTAIILVLVFFILILAFKTPKGFTENIKWGTIFSKKFSVDMGLDWQKNYLAILDELKPKNLRLAFYWNEIEPQKGIYNFTDYDWMIKEAEKRNIKLILIIGRKVPRWPECFEPQWVQSQNSNLKSQVLLEYIKEIVNRYKNSSSLYEWQVENEPFLPYGDCPAFDPVFLDQEINLVHSLDSNHQILITGSGELSSWMREIKKGDIFGTTMYRIVWDKNLGYVNYFFMPRQFYWLKANFARIFSPQKPIIVSELQAEPWGPGLIYNLSVETQMQSMDLKQFNKNIEFAKSAGFPEVYLWGAEWWYWMKEKQNDDSFWNYAKEIINL